MMKLTFILFAVLLAVVPQYSQAYALGEPLESAQPEIVITDETHFTAEGLVGDIRGKAEQWGEELRKRVNEFLQKVDERVNKLMQKINERITEITGDESIPAECRKLAENVRDTALAVVANQTRCVRDVLESGKSYISNIREIQNEVNTELKALREEARQCKDNEDVKGFKTSIKSIVCVNKVGVKAFWVAVKRVPEVISNAAHLRSLVKSLPTTLSQCASKNGSDTLAENVEALLSGVKQCVKDYGEGMKPQPEVTEVPEVTSTAASGVTDAPAVEELAPPQTV